MWKKIQSDGQSTQLKIGTILIEYPIMGKPAKDLNFNDIKNLNSFQVIMLNPLTGEIDLSLPVMETSDMMLLTKDLKLNTLDDSPPILHKYFEDFKKESIWWIEEPVA